MSDQDTRDRRQRKRQLANKKHHHGKRQAKPKQYGQNLSDRQINVRNWETYRNDD